MPDSVFIMPRNAPSLGTLPVDRLIESLESKPLGSGLYRCALCSEFEHANRKRLREHYLSHAEISNLQLWHQRYMESYNALRRRRDELKNEIERKRALYVEVHEKLDLFGSARHRRAEYLIGVLTQ